MRPTIRQCAPRRSSVLRSQRQRHRQRIGPSVLMTSKSSRQLRRSRCLATRHARAAENSRAVVVGTGRLQLTQAGETAFQETMRHRGRYESTVAGRSRRPDDVERRQ